MRAFNEVGVADATEQWKAQIKNEIAGLKKDYILGVDETEYQAFLLDKYTLQPLEIDFESEDFGEPLKKKESMESELYEGRYTREVYYFTISYRFTGSAEIFKLHSNPWTMTSYDISVNENRGIVSFVFGIDKQDPAEFTRRKEEVKNSAFANLANANKNIIAWNSQLPAFIQQTFSQQKSTLIKENDFFAAIRLTTNKDRDSLYTVPVIKKKIVPQMMPAQKQTFAAVPTIGNETYTHIIKLLNDVGRSMERKPSLYKGKDENGIRDYFLNHLEFRYDSVTATGETFNSAGKTDIILKYAPDGSNLFVAERKFWTGHSGFLATITQLFDRYLTWRDSKVAVMVFVKNNDLTGVLNSIRNEIRNHPYYLKGNGQTNESSLSYVFRLKQDSEKPVQMEVMVFHFDKI